jgi:Flp pilus assembly protein TadD
LRQLGRRDEEERELYVFRAFGDRKQSSSHAVKAERTPFETRTWDECRRLLEENKESEALAYLDSQLAAEKPNSYYLLGVLYFNLQRGSDAVRVLARAAAISPAEADVLAFLGRAYVAQGQYDQAEKALARARALTPNGELPLVGVGELEYAQKHWDAAIRYLEQSKTTQVPALLKLCRAYRLAQSPAKALETAELVRAFGKGDLASLNELEAILASDQGPQEPAPVAVDRSP